jgi:iron complex outermembrane receptor protein
MRNVQLLGAASLLALMFAAEASTAAAETAAGSTQIEELIVTAQRREESANSVGMTITAYSGDILKRAQVTTAEQLTSVVPGLTVAHDTTGLPTYTLRGIGYNVINLGATGTVGIYQDEVAYAFPYMSNGPVYDIQRVEVLKGPQGTLYGRDVTGGLIDFIANKPSKTLEAGATAEFGNYETRNFEGYLSGPLTDTLAGRLSFRSEDSDEGWQHSFTRPSDTLGQKHKLGVRGQLRWQPTAALDVGLSANYWRDTSDTQAAQFLQIGLANPGLTNPAILTPGFLNFANTFHATDASVADWNPLSARSRDLSFSTGLKSPLQRNSEFTALALHTNYRITDNLELVSITSYNHLKRFDATDPTGAPFEFLNIENRGRIYSAAEELRLQGDAGPVKWVLGGYYGRDSIYEEQANIVGQSTSVVGLQNLANSPAVRLTPVFNPLGYGSEQILQGFRDGGNFGDIISKTKSVFADADWQVNEALSFTGGVRFSNNSQTFTGCTGHVPAVPANLSVIWNTAIRFILIGGAHLPDPGIVPPNGCVTYSVVTGRFGLVKDSLDEDSVSGRIGVNWKPAENLLTYGTISKGVKAGVFPLLAASEASQFHPATQEKLTAYETGLKAGLFDRKVQVNLAAFYYDYGDKQLSARVPDRVFTTLVRIINVPKSKASGLDGDVTWRVTPELTVRASGTYVETKVTQSPPDAVDAAAKPVDLTGKAFPFTPKVQGTLLISYERPLTPSLGLRANLNGSYQSDSEGVIEATPALRLKGYGLLNGSIGLYSIGGRWEVSVWGRNLADKFYYTNTAQALDTVYAYAGMPRTYGISLSSHF